MHSEITTTTTTGRFDTEPPFGTHTTGGRDNGHDTRSDQGTVDVQKPRVSDADGQALLERFVVGYQEAFGLPADTTAVVAMRTSMTQASPWCGSSATTVWKARSAEANSRWVSAMPAI